MEERVLPLAQEVAHGVAAAHPRQVPEGVVEHGEQSGVRVWHGRTLGTQLEVAHSGGAVGATDKVEPLLHGVLEHELG